MDSKVIVLISRMCPYTTAESDRVYQNIYTYWKECVN